MIYTQLLDILQMVTHLAEVVSSMKPDTQLHISIN